MKTIKLICIEPTSNLTKGKEYDCTITDGSGLFYTLENNTSFYFFWSKEFRYELEIVSNLFLFSSLIL